MQLTPSPPLTLVGILSSFRRAFSGIVLMSGVVNVLTLTGSFFMLQVYDRVVPGRSVPTLVGLAVLAGTLFVFQGVLELIRSRLMVRLGQGLDAKLSPSVYSALMRLPLRAKPSGDGLQPLRDLDQVRAFIGSPGPTALFDLPWMPLYIGICFIFHFWIGVTALAGAVVLFALTLLAEFRTRGPTRIAGQHAAVRSSLAEATRRNAEAMQAMGFGGRIAERWHAVNAEYLNAHAAASDVAGTLGTISKILRLMLQSAMLAIGAYLVIQQEATGGIMIASSIMMGRALAPIELAIAHWKGFIAARQSWARLKQLLADLPEGATGVTLPAPVSALVVENISVAPPGERTPVVWDASFSLAKGSGLGIIGPSASGKSSLARMLVGYWAPTHGKICLDGASLDQWAPDTLGRHIGYLPQDVELLSGTVAQNISRFEPNAAPEAVRAAAAAAGVHDMIVSLPDGYGMQIGERGAALSAGQAQRIALARALYRDPFLVVLDEPNSNLDAEGDAALTQAILGVRARGGIVVVIAHRPSAIAGVDLLLAMKQGAIVALGPKEHVLAKVLEREPSRPPLRIVPESGSA